MKKSTKEKIYFALAALAAVFLLRRGLSEGHEPPPDDSGNTPPTIPPQSTEYQLYSLTFDSNDVGITSLGNWVAGLGVRPHQMSDTGIIVHILVKDLNGLELGHFMRTTVIARSTSNEFKTVSISGTVRNLTACTKYSAYCWVTNTAQTASYFPVKSGAWRTRGCP